MTAYIQPTSVTFWAGLLLVLRGAAQMFGVDIPLPDELLAGVAAIGLRRALK